MAVLALAVVGAAIAPAGYAAVGWAVGSLIGQFLFQKKSNAPDIHNQGPRLGDTRVQAASYGVAIVDIEGTMRAAGNIIWTSGIRETVNQTTEEVGGGGKGGGGDSQTVTTTTYTYDVDLAIGLCEGEIIGVRRIWANGTLIYNVGAAADTATLIASNQNAQNIRFYTGSESQLADPTIEAALGAGNVPGYRGLAYVVFTQLALANYGNSIPNFEFEIVSTGASADLARSTVWSSISAGGVDAMVWDGSSVMAGYLGNSIGALAFWDSTTGFPIAQVPSITGDTFKGWPNTNFAATGVAIDPESRFWTLSFGNVNNLAGWWLIRFTSTGTPDKIVRVQDTGGAGPVNEMKIDAEGTAYWRNGSEIRRYRFIQNATDWDGTNLTEDVEVYASGVGSGYGEAYLGTDGYVHWLNTTTGTYYTAYPGGIQGVAVAGFNTSVPFQGLRFDQQGRPWCAWRETVPATHYEIKRFNATSGAIEQTIVLANGASLDDFIFPKDGFLWLNSGDAWTKRLAADGSLVATVSGTSTNHLAQFSATTLFSASQANATVDLFIIEPLPRLTPSNTTTVGDAVERLCEDAGLSTAEVDVTGLTDILYGYVRSRPMTARAAIEPLAQAFFFDAVESDSVIKFVKRGDPTPIVVSPDSFARADGASAPPQLTYVRTDEIDAPRQVTVGFSNRNADYLDASEYARRLVTRAQEQVFAELPLALTPDEAAQIADVLLYNAHAERTRYTWATGPQYIKHEPTDVFSITSEGITHVIRAVKKTEDGFLCRWEGLADYQSGYTSDASGATDQDEQTTIGIGGPTTLALLDIPLLRDIDDDAGFYAAMRGSFAGWRGAQLYASADDSAYAAVGAVNTSATMGYATTALGDFYGGNVFDEGNSVTVQFENGTPASASELDVLNGANVALLGSEIIQFKTATLVSGTTYTISGLLRGRRGTETAMPEHSIGDRFILLAVNSGMLRANRPSSEIGVGRYYRAPSFGTALALATSVGFTNNAVGLKPLRPVYLNGARNSVGGDLIIKWVRRGRIVWGWLNFSDVPIGEDSESYEIDILNSSDVVLRTLTATTTTVTYTSAQQVTDFGSAQASIRVRVYQISATVDRGFAASGTL